MSWALGELDRHDAVHAGGLETTRLLRVPTTTKRTISTPKENAMSQSHLVVDFPIKGPANAKVLPEELPPLMPDLAKAQDDLGTVHFSRFMIEGDEKLLFLSDIDGEVDQHIERLVESAGPVFDAIFEHVDDPPATSAADSPERVIKWLKRHVREPIDTYFAYEDASVQDIKACVREADFTGSTPQGALLTYWTLKSRLQAFALKLVAGALVGDKADKASDSIGTLHVAHFVPFENNHLGFFTIYDGDFAKYIQDFADKDSFIFDTLFPHTVGAPPTPVAKNAQAFYQWALDNNYPAIGFYSAYPGLSVQDIRALLADRMSPAVTAG